MSEEVFDKAGAARYLGVSDKQMIALAKSGRVTYARIDRLHWRFLKRDLDAYIARNSFKDMKTVYGK